MAEVKECRCSDCKSTELYLDSNYCLACYGGHCLSCDWILKVAKPI